MNVDPNKVHLSEKDIEDWLWENPDEVEFGFTKVDRWLARQFQVPSGIIDLIGITQSGYPIIVELKNTEIKADALTQICRYAADVERIMARAGVELLDNTGGLSLYMPKIVIGQPFSNRVQHEADALNIQLYTFDIEYRVNVSGPWRFKSEIDKQHEAQREELATHPVMTEIAAALDEIYQRHYCGKEIETDNDGE